MKGTCFVDIMQKIDGERIAREILEEIKGKTAGLKRKPVLAMFLVGDDPSSQIYICKKKETCEKVGIISKTIELTEGITQEDLLDKIDEMNNDDEIDAILVQLPLPDQIDERVALEKVSPEKDVDCLHSQNFGKFCEYGSKGSTVVPVTALAVMEILERSNVRIEGKNAVVVGSSNIVGKPTALGLVEKGATVTICHDKSEDLQQYTKQADILVVAVGKKHLITKDMVKKNAVVIDVGITREHGKIYGDVDFEGVAQVASLVTPVPGGVGPVTVAVLLKNTLKLFEKYNSQRTV